MHSTDRLTAAVNNLGDRDLFQQRYGALLAHYGLKAQAINARKAHENGDAEQSQNRFKTAVDQALMPRGSRDFEDQADYNGSSANSWPKATGDGPSGSARTDQNCEIYPRGASTPGAGAGASHPGKYDPDECNRFGYNLDLIDLTLFFPKKPLFFVSRMA